MEKEIQIVRENIRKACERSGRKPEEVLLIGVSKTKPYEAIQEAYSFGIRDFGENKVQEIRDKFALLQEDSLLLKDAPSFHMIGSLQKNKVKYLPGRVKMIHSIDSLPLALEVEKEYAKKGKSPPFCWRSMWPRKKVNPASSWKRWSRPWRNVKTSPMSNSAVL